MTERTIWGIRLIDWTAESTRAKDQISDVPSTMFATLEAAKSAAYEWAEQEFKEYHEGQDEQPEFPKDQAVWVDEPNGSWLGGFEGVAYDNDEQGFWVYVYPVTIDL